MGVDALYLVGDVTNFDEATVRRLLDTAPLAPSGAASLTLAWEHRDAR